MAVLVGTLSQDVVLRMYTTDSTARCKSISRQVNASYMTCLSALPLLHAAPGDYEPINRTLTFNGETSRIVIPVRVVNDDIDEEDTEMLVATLRLEPVEGDSPNVQVVPDQATLLIQDDDSKMNVHSHPAFLKRMQTLPCRNSNWRGNSLVHGE